MDTCNTIATKTTSIATHQMCVIVHIHIHLLICIHTVGWCSSQFNHWSMVPPHHQPYLECVDSGERNENISFLFHPHNLICFILPYLVYSGPFELLVCMCYVNVQYVNK